MQICVFLEIERNQSPLQEVMMGRQVLLLYTLSLKGLVCSTGAVISWKLGGRSHNVSSTSSIKIHTGIVITIRSKLMAQEGRINNSGSLGK